MPRDAAPLLELVPAGEVADDVIPTLGRDLEAAAGLQWHRGEPLALDADARRPDSGLYPSILLMHALMDRRDERGGDEPARWTLAITEDGLCAEGVGPVFGEAEVEGCCAVIGLAPLRAGSGADADVLRGRVLAEALHELGHLGGAEHCRRTSCVMYPSLDIADTDLKSAAFCADCAARVTWCGARKA